MCTLPGRALGYVALLFSLPDFCTSSEFFFSSSFFLDSISWVRQFSCDFFREWKTLGCTLGDKLICSTWKMVGGRAGFSLTWIMYYSLMVFGTASLAAACSYETGEEKKTRRNEIKKMLLRRLMRPASVYSISLYIRPPLP
ncbi:hypothetical protein V8C35DRAFT_238577 [Trichoderma chlorosporum]